MFQRIEHSPQSDQPKGVSAEHTAANEKHARSGYLVVMTACIDPSTGPFTTPRMDPALRLQDYDQALRFWLEHPDPRLNRILFLENSGYPLDVLRATAAEHASSGKRVEFVSMKCNYAPPGIGSGYPEFAMLDEGLAASELARESLYWIKVTGRLRFLGLSKLLDRLPKDYLFAVDCRDNKLFVKIQQRFATAQLMIFRADFFLEKMTGFKNRIKGICVENDLFDYLISYRGQKDAILRWPVNVDPEGIAGHSLPGHSENYRSPRRRMLNLARAVFRRVVPWWWV